MPMMELLQKHGASPNWNLDYNKPLPIACNMLWVEGVQWLLTHGGTADTFAGSENRFSETRAGIRAKGDYEKNDPALLQTIDAAIKIYALLFHYKAKLPSGHYKNVAVSIKETGILGLKLVIDMSKATAKVPVNLSKTTLANADLLKTPVSLQEYDQPLGVDGPLEQLEQLVDAAKVKIKQGTVAKSVDLKESFILTACMLLFASASAKQRMTPTPKTTLESKNTDSTTLVSDRVRDSAPNEMVQPFYNGPIDIFPREQSVDGAVAQQAALSNPPSLQLTAKSLMPTVP